MVVVKNSLHMREVVVIRNKLSTRMDLYVDIEKNRIINLIREIFLDGRYFFLKITNRVHVRVHNKMF